MSVHCFARSSNVQVDGLNQRSAISETRVTQLKNLVRVHFKNPEFTLSDLSSHSSSLKDTLTITLADKSRCWAVRRLAWPGLKRLGLARLTALSQAGHTTNQHWFQALEASKECSCPLVSPEEGRRRIH